jgi:hypothetical protein
MRYSLQIPSMSEEEMVSMVNYVKERNIFFELQEYPGDDEWSQNDTVKRVPTSHFAKISGSECLNNKGMMSKKDAYHVLEHYMKIHKVHEENGLIYIDEWIQQLIQETRSTITRKELRAIVDRLFD